MSSIDRLAASRRQREQEMEMARLNNPGPRTAFADSPAPHPTPHPVAHEGGPNTFLAEVASIEQDIQRLNSNVAAVSATRTHYLTSIDGSLDEDNERLERLTGESRQLTQSIKARLEDLERQAHSQNQPVRRNQIALLRKHFLEAIQNYQREEYAGDQRSRQQIAKQLQIVKPNATPDEIQEYIDEGHQQVFAEALTTSTRYGESRLAYNEVQIRQEDLRRMERTLAELAQLFNDMAVLVEQQDATVNAVEQVAVDVEQNTKSGLDSTRVAVKHARNYRRGRWICFGIILLVCAILAIVLGVVFGTRK